MTREEIQQTALETIRDKKQAGINVSMGVGKTYIGLQDMRLCYHDTVTYLVVVPTNSILQGWKDEIEKHGMQGLLEHITFSTYRSLNKQENTFDVVYLDECHSLKFSHGHWLTAHVAKGGRLIGMTGTYPKYMKTEKGKMCDHFIPKLYEYEMDDAVDDNILNDYEIVVHQLKLDHNKTLKKSGKNGDWITSEAVDYQYWCRQIEDCYHGAEMKLRILRMKAMQSYPSKIAYVKKLLSSQTDKTIVFVNYKKQADEVSPYIHYSGKKKISEANLEKFKTGEILELAAVEQLSQGINIPDLKVGIISHAYANNRQASQKIGRLLRLNPDDKATIHILCYVDSIDKNWVTSALEGLNKERIRWVDPI